LTPCVRATTHLPPRISRPSLITSRASTGEADGGVRGERVPHQRPRRRFGNVRDA
jgi:hypothetical protein